MVGQRLLDTRAGIGAVAGKVAPGQTVRLVVGGRAVPAGTEAVVLNITVTEPDGDGFVTVFPCGSAPLASNLNYRAGQTIANLSVVSLDAAGAVCLTSMSPAHLIADLNGFFPADAGFHGTVPARLLDTRAGVGAPAGRLAAGGVVTLPITGRPEARIPGDASAVVLNVTATEPEAAGFVTVWPCDQPQPAASNLNVDGGATVPNLVIAPLGADGTVCLSTMSGVQLLADVEGWFGPDAPYHGVNPTRLLDTRSAGGPRVAAGQTVELSVAGAVPADADAVVVNVTAAGSDGGGFVTVWPCGAGRPNASNLNVGNADTRPNLVVSKVGDGGRICLYTSSATHLVVDFEGWFAG